MNQRLLRGAAVLALVAPAAAIVACHNTPSEPAPPAQASASSTPRAAPDAALADAGTGDSGAGDAGDAGPTDGGRDGSTKPAAKVTANAAKKLVGTWSLSVSAESAMKTRQDIQDKNPNMSEKQLDWELKLKKKRLDVSTYEFTGKELKKVVGTAPVQTDAYTVDREEGPLVTLKFKSGKSEVFKFSDENTFTTIMPPDGEVTFTRK